MGAHVTAPPFSHDQDLNMSMNNPVKLVLYSAWSWEGQQSKENCVFFLIPWLFLASRNG